MISISLQQNQARDERMYSFKLFEDARMQILMHVAVFESIMGCFLC